MLMRGVKGQVNADNIENQIQMTEDERNTRSEINSDNREEGSYRCR
jgi:hypothetical protein